MDTFQVVQVNIRRIRQQAKLSQMDVAERMGIDQGNYSRLESGAVQPTLRTLFKLSNALGCDPFELLLPAEYVEATERLKRFKELGPKGWHKAIGALDLVLHPAGSERTSTEVKRAGRKKRQKPRT